MILEGCIPAAVKFLFEVEHIPSIGIEWMTKSGAGAERPIAAREAGRLTVRYIATGKRHASIHWSNEWSVGVDFAQLNGFISSPIFVGITTHDFPLLLRRLGNGQKIPLS